MASMIVLGHFLVGVPHQTLHVLLLETLLLVQPGTDCAGLMEGRVLNCRQLVVGLQSVWRLGEGIGQEAPPSPRSSVILRRVEAVYLPSVSGRPTTGRRLASPCTPKPPPAAPGL